MIMTRVSRSLTRNYCKTNQGPEQPGPSGRRRSSRLSFLANPVSDFKIPTFAAPWQHGQVGPRASSSKTVRYFDRNKQWWRLFTNGLIQWMLTLAIVGMIVAALWGFAQVKPLSRWQRYTFNAVITLLSLCLGLAIVSALRSYAKLLSWRFLAAEYRDLQDFELIMNCESQSKVLKLFWAGRTPGKFRINRTQLLCLASLGLVIGLQIVIALMGLTYSVESSDTVRNHTPGNVSLVDLSDIKQRFWQSMESDASYIQRTAAANLYGTVGSEYNYYIAQPGKPHLDEEIDGWYGGTASIGSTTDAWATSFYYQFIEWPTRSSSNVWGETTRYIQSDASCTRLVIVEGGYIENTTVSYFDENGEFHIQTIYTAASLTSTYMANQSEYNCGPRCTNILILDTGSIPEDDESADIPSYEPMLWACNSTISQVYNADTCTNSNDCTLSDELARIVTGAIGFSGTYYPGEHMQSQLYPAGSMFSWGSYNDVDDKNVTMRASLVAWFTIGVIAAMDGMGLRITAPGMEPTTGMVLDIKWQYTIPVLAIIPGVQLVVLLIVCIWANGAMVKDGSYLATARMLRPVVDKLGEHGCALTGDEIARELGNFKIIYGARAPNARPASTAYTSAGGSDVDWHCGIIAESEGYGRQAEEGWLPGRVWPAGRYDGVGYSDAELPVSDDSSRQRKSMPPLVEEEIDDEDEDINDEKAHLL